jgi:hypothetical protein
MGLYRTRDTPDYPHFVLLYRVDNLIEIPDKYADLSHTGGNIIDAEAVTSRLSFPDAR